MRDFNIIINDIEAYLLKRSENPDEDYKTRKQHFEKFKLLLENKEYSELALHIEKGIKQFDKISIFTQNYYNFLTEFRQHFVPQNAEDKQKRITKLIAAIMRDDVQAIERALNSGCLAVFNSPYQRGELSTGIKEGLTPLQIAVTHGKWNAFKYLLSRVDLIQKAELALYLEQYYYSEKNVNPVVSQNQYTLLHLAAQRNIGDITLLSLDSNDFDVNAVTTSNTTALWLACAAGHEDMAIRLLEKGADPNLLPFDETLTPLLFAIKAQQPRLVLNLLQSGAKVDEITYKIARDYAKNNPEYQDIYDMIKPAIPATCM